MSGAGGYVFSHRRLAAAVVRMAHRAVIGPMRSRLGLHLRRVFYRISECARAGGNGCGSDLAREPTFDCAGRLIGAESVGAHHKHAGSGDSDSCGDEYSQYEPAKTLHG